MWGGVRLQSFPLNERAPAEWRERERRLAQERMRAAAAAGGYGGPPSVPMAAPPEWRRVTGEEPPPSPVDRAACTRAGLPWYDYYDDEAEDLAPTDTLGDVRPVGDRLGDDHKPWRQPSPHQVQPPKDAPGEPVQDGDW